MYGFQDLTESILMQRTPLSPQTGVTRLARVEYTLKVFTVSDYRCLLQSKRKEAALMMGDQPSHISNLSDESAWRGNSRLSVCFTRNNRVTQGG